MYRIAFRLFMVSLVCLGVVACGKKQEPQPEGVPEGHTVATPEQLVDIWEQLVALPKEQINFELAHGVAQDISVRGADGIMPLLRKLDTAEPTPQRVVLSLAALRKHIKPEHEALLVELSGPTKSKATRTVAIDLLGALETETVKAKLAELEQDSDPMIAVVAYLAHLQSADDAYIARFMGFWNNPGVHDSFRQEMVRRLPEAHAGKVVEALSAAVVRMDWPVDMRQRLVGLLGFVNDPKALEAVKQAAANSPEPELREYATRAVAAIEARIAAGGEIQTVEVGPDGVHQVGVPLTAEPGGAPDAAAPPAAPAQ